jgi:hypothetical protein
MDSARTLAQKHKKAVAGSSDSQKAFDALNSSIDKQIQDLWSAAEEKALRRRDRHEEAMDIYDVTAEKGWTSYTPWPISDARLAPSRAQIQLQLAEEEDAPMRGVTTWLACGIKIEETQSVSN